MVQAESSFSYIRKKLILGSSLLARARFKPTSLELRGRLKIRRKKLTTGSDFEAAPESPWTANTTIKTAATSAKTSSAATMITSFLLHFRQSRGGTRVRCSDSVSSWSEVRRWISVGRGCVALLLPTQQPWVQIPAPWVFFSLLLSLWTELRLNQSSAKQWILQMQLAATSRAKHYKDSFFMQAFPVTYK